jgi:hypothetical protein
MRHFIVLFVALFFLGLSHDYSRLFSSFSILIYLVTSFLRREVLLALMVVVILVEGSFFKERIATAVQGTLEDVEHKFCTTVDEARQYNPHKLLLDLEHPQAIEILKQYREKVVAFGPFSEELFEGIHAKFGAMTYSRTIIIKDIHKII